MDWLVFDKKVLRRFEASISEFPTTGIAHAFNDVSLIVSLVEKMESELPTRKVFEPNLSTAERYIEFQKSRLISAELKAIYFLADYYLAHLLGAICGHSSLSMNKFIDRSDSRFDGVDSKRLLKGYCVSIYRNKIVAHLDIARHGGTSTNPSGVHYLNPFSEEFNISNEDVTLLESLKQKYEIDIPELKTTNNSFKLLSTLFYSVPIGAIGELSDDRKVINQIAEKGGCQSLSATEILDALIKFTEGLADCLETPQK